MAKDTDKKRDQGDFYVVVDDYHDHPETGQLMLKQPLFRVKFLAVNNPAYRDADGVMHSAEKAWCEADKWNGVYAVEPNDRFAKQKNACMAEQVKRHPGKIIGPFATREEAVFAKHTVRKKTPKEAVAAAEQKVQAQEQELTQLRERLLSLEQGGKGKPATRE